MTTRQFQFAGQSLFTDARLLNIRDLPLSYQQGNRLGAMTCEPIMYSVIDALETGSKSYRAAPATKGKNKKSGLV
jgi:hypothetical protein